MTTLDENQTPARSHLFTVRVWREELGDGQAEWRGQVQHALSGESRAFRGWEGLVTCLLALLRHFDTGVTSRSS